MSNDVLLTVYTIQIQVPFDLLMRSKRNVIFQEAVLLMPEECCSLWLSRYFCKWGGSVDA